MASVPSRSSAGRDWQWPESFDAFAQLMSDNASLFFLDMENLSIMNMSEYRYFYSDLIRKDVFEHAGVISTLSLECQLAVRLNARTRRGVRHLAVPTHALCCLLKWLGAVEQRKQRRVEITLSLMAPFFATLKIDNAGKITARLDKEVPKTWLSCLLALEWAIQRLRELPFLCAQPFFVYTLFTGTLSSRMMVSRMPSSVHTSKNNNNNAAAAADRVDPDVVKYFYASKMHFTGVSVRGGAGGGSGSTTYSMDADLMRLDDSDDVVGESPEARMRRVMLARQANQIAKHFRPRTWHDIVTGKSVSESMTERAGQVDSSLSGGSNSLRYEHVPPSATLPIPPVAATAEVLESLVVYTNDDRDDHADQDHADDSAGAHKAGIPLDWLADVQTPLFFEPRDCSKWCGPILECLQSTDWYLSPVRAVTLALLKHVSACDAREQTLENKFRPTIHRDPLALNHRRVVFFDIMRGSMACVNAKSLHVMTTGYRTLMNAAQCSAVQQTILVRALRSLRKEAVLFAKRYPRLFRTASPSRAMGTHLLEKHLVSCFPELSPESTCSGFVKSCATRVFKCLAAALHQCRENANDRGNSHPASGQGRTLVSTRHTDDNNNDDDNDNDARVEMFHQSGAFDDPAHTANNNSVPHVHLTISDWENANARSVARGRQSLLDLGDAVDWDVGGGGGGGYGNDDGGGRGGRIGIFATPVFPLVQRNKKRKPNSVSMKSKSRSGFFSTSHDEQFEEQHFVPAVDGMATAPSALVFSTARAGGLGGGLIGTGASMQPTSCLLTLLMLHLPHTQVLERDTDPHFEAVMNSSPRAPSHCGCWQDYLVWQPPDDDDVDEHADATHGYEN